MVGVRESAATAVKKLFTSRTQKHTQAHTRKQHIYVQYRSLTLSGDAVKIKIPTVYKQRQY